MLQLSASVLQILYFMKELDLVTVIKIVFELKFAKMKY